MLARRLFPWFVRRRQPVLSYSGLRAVAGPYRIAVAATYVGTAVIGDVYSATAAAGEAFSPGAARGQVVATEY